MGTASLGGPVSTLLSALVDAHGGLAAWRSHSTVSAVVDLGSISTQGVLSTKFHLVASTQMQIVCLDGYGPDGCITSFSPARVELNNAQGEVLHCADPALLDDWQARIGVSADLGDICALSVALWTYLNFPFVATLEGFASSERARWRGDSEEGRTLMVDFPVPPLGPRTRLLAYVDADGRTRRIDWYAPGLSRAASCAEVLEQRVIDGVLVPVRLRVRHLCAGPEPPTTATMLTSLSTVGFR